MEQSGFGFDEKKGVVLQMMFGTDTLQCVAMLLLNNDYTYRKLC